MATFDEFVSSLRAEFGEQGAGKKFEVFCKWFLEVTSEVYHHDGYKLPKTQAIELNLINFER